MKLVALLFTTATPLAVANNVPVEMANDPNLNMDCYLWNSCKYEVEIF